MAVESEPPPGMHHNRIARRRPPRQRRNERPRGDPRRYTPTKIFGERFPGRRRGAYRRAVRFRAVAQSSKVAGTDSIRRSDIRLPYMKREMRFEEPHPGLQDSYRSLVREFLERGEPLVPFALSFPNEDFPAFLAQLASCKRGEGLPAGFVAHSTYWLVCNDIVVGVSNLRHSLTDALRREGGHIGYGVRPSARRQGFASELLRRTLGCAREIGITEAWLTCAKTNIASVRTILRNGGRFVSEVFLPERNEVVQRYEIPLYWNEP